MQCCTSEATGKILIAGNDKNNALEGGMLESSLWGGAGVDTFYYGLEEGRDVIKGANNLDKVMVYSPGFENGIDRTVVSGNDLLIMMKDNYSVLTVQGWNGGEGVNTFELADGTKWGFDAKTEKWEQK